MVSPNLGVPKLKTVYTAWCFSHFHADGSRCESPWACPHGLSFEDHDHKLKWVDGFENLVVTAGRNALLDNTFNAAAGAVTWYVGLKGTGTPDPADTLASHSTWSELNPYSGNRPAWTKNGAASAGAMSNSSSKASFAINAGTTVYGAFLASANSGTSGTLYGAGDFTASRAVVSGDTLNVQVDLSVTSS